MSIRVFNTFGEVVYSIKDINGKIAWLNLNQANGVYYTEVITSKERISNRFIISRY